MTEIFHTVAPVFGIILFGFLAPRLKLFDAALSPGLTHYVFVIGIPALLFRAMVTVALPDQAPWPLYTGYFGALAVVWLAMLAVSRRVPALAEGGGSGSAMAATYGNVVMLGLPVAFAHFGPEGALVAALIVAVQAPILWTAAVLNYEVLGQHHHVEFRRVGKELAVALAGNPIVSSLVAGALWRLTGIGLHPVPDKMLSLIGDTGVPLALFALGLSLSTYRFEGHVAPAAVIMAFKMLLLPLLVFMLLHYVFEASPLWTAIATLVAAQPTGANAYLFAVEYDAGKTPVSVATALGTALAFLTVPGLLWFVDYYR
jgi:hypothetical protein